MKTILMIALGSAGDVHPMVGLSLELKRRGHRVLLVAGAAFDALAERVGLEFIGLGRREEFERVKLDPDLWHPTRSFALVAKKLMIPAMRDVFAIIESHASDGDVIVAAPATSMGARIAQEVLGVPLASVHLQPSMMRSVYENPVFALPDIWSRMPKAVKSFLFAAVDRYWIDPLLTPELNAFRAEFGLPPVKRMFDGWIHSPDLTVGLFPDWFAPIQPDWPASVHLTGFPLYDEKGSREIPPDLETFLREGEAPVVFTAGSAMAQGEAFFRESLAVCKALRCRGILLAQHAEQIPEELPQGMRHFAYIPFSEVLPRSAALVHHGGIGTTAQALAAGIPQLVTPMTHDQPDNAVRVKRLGVGDYLLPSSYRAKRAAPMLERLLRAPKPRESARRYAHLLAGHDAIHETCDLIERTGEIRTSSHEPRMPASTPR